MKSLLFSVLSYLVFIPFFTQAQEAKAFKEGIYFTYQELLENTPFYTDSISVVERSSGDLIWAGGSKYSFELPGANKQQLRDFKKKFFFVFHQDTLYVADKLTTNGRGMTPCFLSGPYLIADANATVGTYGGGLVGAMIKLGEGYLIDLKKGESVPLTRKVLKTLMAQYPEIERKYAGEKHDFDDVLRIVERINELEREKAARL